MASGDTLLVFTALNGEPPSANMATLDTRNQHAVLDFDDSTDESIMFSAIMPRHYNGGGVDVIIHYAMTSAVADEVIWNTDFERIGDQAQDIDSDGFTGSPQTVTDTVPDTSGEVGVCNTSHENGAEIDSIEVGDGFRLKITRDADNAADNATGDAELLRIEIRET